MDCVLCLASALGENPYDGQPLPSSYSHRKCLPPMSPSGGIRGPPSSQLQVSAKDVGGSPSSFWLPLGDVGEDPRSLPCMKFGCGF